MASVYAPFFDSDDSNHLKIGSCNVDASHRQCKSVKILDYTNYKCGLEKDKTLQFGEIINFERGLSPSGFTTNHNRCVMCGVTDAAIPTQNKNVCKSCDSVPWLVKSPEVVVKFCKGCKNFVFLADFSEKPGAAKCAKCRLRGRNNYLKSKKGSSVATNAKIESALELALPAKAEKEFPEPDLESESHFLESSSLDMLVVSDNFNTDIPYLEAVLEPFQESRGENVSRSPFDFLSASSPFPNIGPGVSCSSTYNSACNYNTNKKTDLNTEMRGRRSRWSNIECETAATKRPPFPIIKKTKNTSIAKTPHNIVNFQIAESDRGGGPRPLSHLSKPSPAFSMSPFLAFCLTDAVMEESVKGPTGDTGGTAAAPAQSSSPAPATPNLTSNRPASCQLVDRWAWDSDSNPLMQLVRATETFAPQSPNKFITNGSQLMNKKRKKMCLKKENVPDNVQMSEGTHTDEKKYPKKVKIIDEILAAERLDIGDESDSEMDRDSVRESVRESVCVLKRISVSAASSGTHLDGDRNINHNNNNNNNDYNNNNDDSVTLARGESLLSRTGNGYYNTSHNNNNNNNIAGSERDEIGDCTDCNDGNASDTLSISSLAKTVSIDDMGLELDPGYTAEYPIVSDEYIAEYPILIACDCSMSEGGSRPLSHANTAHSELMSLQRRGVGVSAEAGAGTVIAQRVDTRMNGVAGVSKEDGARGRAVRLHESQETKRDNDGECEEEDDDIETACKAPSLSLPVQETESTQLRRQAACKAQVYLAVSKCFRDLSKLYSEQPCATHTFPPFSQVQMPSNALPSAYPSLPLSLPLSASASSSSSSDSSPSTDSFDITTHYCNEEEPLPLPLPPSHTEEYASSDKENRQELSENVCYSNSQLPPHISAFAADNMDKGPKHPGVKGSGSPIHTARFSDPRKKVLQSHPSPYIAPKDLQGGSGISGSIVTNKSPLGVGPTPSLCPSRPLLEPSCSVALEELEQWFLKWGNVLK